jgi:outer membrane biosynthesis protein TonB
MSGNISNRGKASLAAEATPLGKYQNLIRQAVGVKWNRYTRDRIDLISIGTAKIKFFVTASGHVEQVRVLSNTSNEIFATCSLQAVLDAEIPPIPPDVAAALENEGLEVEFSFTMYSN